MGWFDRKYRSGRRVGTGMRTVCLLNQSKDPAITKTLLDKIAAAMFAQLIEDYAPFWESAAPDHVVVAMATNLMPIAAAPIVILDEPDEPDALGYHFATAQGLPIGRVFWNPVKAANGTLFEGANSLSQTISHELLEMLGDPYANFWADCGAGQEDAIELCDRVEGDSYFKKGVSVSNFLGPRSFREGIGPFDFLSKLENPFDLTPGGYAIRRKGGPGGTVKQIYGKDVPQWKKDLHAVKKHSRLAKRRSA